MGREGGNMNDLIIILAIAMIWPGFYLYRKYKSKKSEKTLVFRKPSQRELYWYCNNCHEWVHCEHMPDGKTFLNTILESKITEIENFSLVHHKCGTEYKFAVAERTPLMDLPKELRL